MITPQKKIAESYLIKVTDDKFTDALKKAINDGWLPWGAPTFLSMTPSLDIPRDHILVLLTMVKYMPSKFVRQPSRHPVQEEEESG